MSAPFVWIYVCFAAGTFAATVWHIPFWVLLCSFGSAILALRISKYFPALTVQSLLLILVAYECCELQDRQYRTNELRLWVKEHAGETIAVTGTVARTPEITPDYFVLFLDVESVGPQTIRGRARLTVTGKAGNLPVFGDRVETYVRFRLASNFRSDGAFDYERYLRKERIHVLGTVKNSILIRVSAGKTSLRNLISRLRLYLIEEINSTFSRSHAGLLRALWLDDRRELTSEIEQKFIDAGVFHVIAISGFHVAVVIWFIFFLLKHFVRYRTALAIVAIILTFYFLLLEGRSSITRTFLTFVILVFAFLYREGIRWGNVLAASAFAQLVLNPLELFDAGYQLTYLSTATLLFLAVPICRNVRLPRPIYQRGFDFLVANACIQFVLAPYQAFVFYKVPFASLMANCLVLPISSGLIAAAPFFLPIMNLHASLPDAVSFCLEVFVSAADFFSESWVHVVPAPSAGVVFLFYAALTGVIVTKNRPRLRSACILLCAGFLFWILYPPRKTAQKDFVVHILDVGQGDAILLQYPDGTFDLVDSGGFWSREAFDTGEAILFPYLSRLGVRQLGRVFLTHAHTDHMNGFATVLRYVPAREFYVTRRPVGELSFRNFLYSINRNPISISRGKEFIQAGVRLRVLAPEDTARTSKVTNGDSLVLLVEYKGKKILLTGDLEKGGEIKLCSLLENRVDFVKVPHHGSKSSSSAQFLDHLRANIALISVGRDNWFGHPHPEVLKRYRERHALIYRTDQIGSIRVSWNADSSTVDSYVWNHW